MAAGDLADPGGARSRGTWRAAQVVSGEGTGGRWRGPAGGIRQERAKAAEMAGDVDLRRKRETMREHRDGEGATKREEGREGGPVLVVLRRLYSLAARAHLQVEARLRGGGGCNIPNF